MPDVKLQAPIHLALTPLAWSLAMSLLVLAPGAWAQDAGARRFSVSPSLSVSQTFTDNHRVESTNIERSEAITTVGAGLRMAVRGARVRGAFDYSLTGLMYARDSQANDLQNRLQATLQSELVERHVFVDAQASITQQPISALARQTPDGFTSTRNRTEVSTLRLQPRLQGRLAGEVDVQAALSLAATDTGGAQDTTDSVDTGASLSLAGGAGRVGWSLLASRQIVDFKQGRQTENDLVTLQLSVRPDVDWALRARGGVEANDYRRADGKDRYDNFGAGVTWSPSPRTSVSLDGDKRSFGHSHTVALQHRSRRTVLRYTDSQGVTDGAGDTAQSLVGAYDLFFDLLSSQEPDPVLREQLVNDLLQRNNLDRESQIALGFLTSAVTLQRRQELSVAVQGQRTSVLASVFGNDSSRVDTVSSAVDDTAGGSRVRQRGLSLAVNHRVTPTGSASLATSVVRGSELGGLRTDLRTVSATWSDRLGARTSYSLSLRHSEYDADADPYTENALIANLSLRF